VTELNARASKNGDGILFIDIKNIMKDIITPAIKLKIIERLSVLPENNAPFDICCKIFFDLLKKAFFLILASHYTT
jgi:hypothetical protein